MSFKKHFVIIGFYTLIAFCVLHNPIAHMTTDLLGTSPVDQRLVTKLTPTSLDQNEHMSYIEAMKVTQKANI